MWSFDRGSAWLSPNGDGVNDQLVLAARLSERLPARVVVRNAAGTAVWSSTITADIVRFAWDFKTASGALVPDGAYTWTFRAKDAWGNAGASRSGSFTLDHTSPVTKAVVASTAGKSGWSVSPVTVKLTASDKRSGVASSWWRLGSGASHRYGTSAVVSADGTSTLGFRSLDKAGNREGWHTLTVKIDRTPPVIKTTLKGVASLVAGTWRSAVAITPAISDATSGVGAKTVSVDGAPAAALGANPVSVTKDGAHTVVLTASDVAGNKTTTTLAFTIDTKAPIVTLPDASPTPPLVTPNGDGISDAVTLPYRVSEAGTLKAVITAPTGTKVVRTITAQVPAGAGQLVWDGRNEKGVVVPDGRYTVAFTATDAPGNAGAAATQPVDVYAALASVARDTGLFYPQDADALASRATVTFSLRSAAKVSISVLDAQGTVVRRAMTDKALAAGAVTWRWNGKVDGGASALKSLPHRGLGHQRHAARLAGAHRGRHGGPADGVGDERNAQQGVHAPPPSAPRRSRLLRSSVHQRDRPRGPSR
ncbi:MAG: FlgD immunoglobulin-like domain containing protein [Chloroflexota bacterium]